MRNLGGDWSTGDTPTIESVMETFKKYQQVFARLPNELHIPEADIEAMKDELDIATGNTTNFLPLGCPATGLKVYAVPNDTRPFYRMGDGAKVPVRITHNPFSVQMIYPEDRRKYGADPKEE